ncbi:hypothetical protein PENTCL1PPCAC_25711, partial [Pristionchus entomophagus]
FPRLQHGTTSKLLDMQSITIVLLAFVAIICAQDGATTTLPPEMTRRGENGQTPKPEQMTQWPEAQIKAYIATLSPAAQAAVRQMDQVMQQAYRIYNAQSPSVKQEIDGIHKKMMGGGDGNGTKRNDANSASGED